MNTYWSLSSREVRIAYKNRTRSGPFREEVSSHLPQFRKRIYCMQFLSYDMCTSSFILWLAFYIQPTAKQVVANRRLRTMKNFKTPSPKSGHGHLQELQIIGLSLGKFWYFGCSVFYMGQLLTRGGHSWRFDCINKV